jgi:hypothetical protein
MMMIVNPTDIVATCLFHASGAGGCAGDSDCEALAFTLTVARYIMGPETRSTTTRNEHAILIISDKEGPFLIQIAFTDLIQIHCGAKDATYSA